MRKMMIFNLCAPQDTRIKNCFNLTALPLVACISFTVSSFKFHLRFHVYFCSLKTLRKQWESESNRRQSVFPFLRI